MAVTDQLPPEVSGLLKKMVAISCEDRPTLREVHSELLQLHALLSSQGHSARFLKTVWGLPSRGMATSKTISAAPAMAAHVAWDNDVVQHQPLSPRNPASEQDVQSAAVQSRSTPGFKTVRARSSLPLLSFKRCQSVFCRQRCLLSHDQGLTTLLFPNLAYVLNSLVLGVYRSCQMQQRLLKSLQRASDTPTHTPTHHLRFPSLLNHENHQAGPSGSHPCTPQLRLSTVPLRLQLQRKTRLTWCKQPPPCFHRLPRTLPLIRKWTFYSSNWTASALKLLFLTVWFCLETATMIGYREVCSRNLCHPKHAQRLFMSKMHRPRVM